MVSKPLLFYNSAYLVITIWFVETFGIKKGTYPSNIFNSFGNIAGIWEKTNSCFDEHYILLNCIKKIKSSLKVLRNKYEDEYLQFR